MGEEDDPHGQGFNRAAPPPARGRPAWSAANPGNRAIRAEALAASRALAGDRLGPDGGRVLDAGCGTGWWLASLIEVGHPARHLWGVDRDPARVTAAAARAPGAAVTAGDLLALPYDDDAFDVVLLMTVLSSVGSAERVRAALGELRRVTAPGGMAIVFEPRVPTPNRTTRLIRTREVSAAYGPRTGARSVTLLPPLARRLPSAEAYARWARVPLLRTHRVTRHARG